MVENRCCSDQCYNGRWIRTTFQGLFLTTFVIYITLLYYAIAPIIRYDSYSLNSSHLFKEYNNTVEIFGRSEEDHIRTIALAQMRKTSLEKERELHEDEEYIEKNAQQIVKLQKLSDTTSKYFNKWPDEPAEDALDYESYYEDNDSSKAGVIAIANDVGLDRLKIFVGSLRRTGYNGQILIGMVPHPDMQTIAYLQGQSVHVHSFEYTNCTWDTSKNVREKCISPYDNIKSEWSRFPLARDLLRKCVETSLCTSSVLLTDVSEVFFQLNPFGAGASVIDRLQLFEEYPHIDVRKSIVRDIILSCGMMDIYNRPLLSAGNVIGPTSVMLTFLDDMYTLMQQWISDPKCYRSHVGNNDVKALINFMRLNQTMPSTTKYFSYRTGIVNNVGHEGTLIFESHIHLCRFRGYSADASMLLPYEGAVGMRWIDRDYLLTDDAGYFINKNSEKSYIVHEYDRFGPPILEWIRYFLNNTESSHNNTNQTTDTESYRERLTRTEEFHNNTDTRKSLEMNEDEIRYYKVKTVEKEESTMSQQNDDEKSDNRIHENRIMSRIKDSDGYLAEQFDLSLNPSLSASGVLDQNATSQ